MEVSVKIPLTIKAKVTEELKTQLAVELQENIKKIDMELQQIEFQSKRMLAEQAKSDASGLMSLRQQIETEKQKRLEVRNQMLDRIKETGQLELDSEIVQGTLERIVNVKLGDDLLKLMQEYLLVDNGKIIEISGQN